MRLITLNIWCGKLSGELIDFVKSKSTTTDVFCFQEVLDNRRGIPSAVFKDGSEDIANRLRQALPEFVGYNAIPQVNERGLATFIKKGWRVESVEEQYVYGKKNTMTDNKWSTIGINMLYTRIRKDEVYNIWNIHGKFVALDKKDYPETLEQSRNIKGIIKAIDGKRILCGDLNLSPHTESIRILEGIPLRNLVTEYGITSTRTRYFEFPEKFADYIMPSHEVSVKKFAVLDDVVSDHLPLLIDCF
ncbi:MAG: endonuclease/exonuclease/phosphatase family protein [Candidatus Marsarchaeota archaeon]|jgi:endonuclease/exonuclease/phosphatase family metal-dependent hydrolase|nr:endonuclease/exonuclease/phosphatase family protein [Candidatus Marsarchaeota archaeon]